MKTFYIVPHSHLDREWYRTFQENRVKLIRFMDDLLDTMEEDPTYTFYSLDAQTSFIDDYFEIKPYNKKRFRKLVQEGRLPIGPWYVQPDEHLPTAEGIIRNMLISKQISDTYADYNRVGYVPDSFGQSAAFPTLLKGFGVDTAVFYRGFAEEDSKFNDFIWEGMDGTQILSNWLPIGYGNAMFLNEDEANNMKVIEENIELLEARSCSENYLMMCGSDQSFIKKFLPETVRRLNEVYKDKNCYFLLATPQHYMDAIRGQQESLDIVYGELRKGKRSRTHNSISATRMDIKNENFFSERKYLRVLEPLSALCEHLGMPDDQELIERGWKYIIENHAHDSICCCCTDDIHRELRMRYLYANQLADYLINEKLEGLHEHICYGEELGRPILLFSSCAHHRTQIVEVDVYVKEEIFAIFDRKGNELPYDIISRESFNLKDTKVSFTPIPDDYYMKTRIRIQCTTSAFGYETVYIREGTVPKKQEAYYVEDERTLSNELIRVRIEEDGSWTIDDLIHGQSYPHQHIFYDDGNAGDEYDYSPSCNDYAVTSLHALKKIELIENTPLCASLKLTYELSIPETTNNECRSENCVPLFLESILEVKAQDPVLYVRTTIHNDAENHRIQVRFDAGRRIDNHFADVQLGELVRENEFNLTQESEQCWHERYYPVFSAHKYCGVENSDKLGFILMNRGIPQYEVYQEETTQMALTLLSSVGYMGNTDLKYRPGRRSGSTDATPESQMKGIYTWEYAFMPIAQGVDRVRSGENYVNPIQAYAFVEFSNEGNLPDRLDLVQSEDVQISCFKTAQNGHILRILNPYDIDKSEAIVKVNHYLYKKITPLDLAEREISDRQTVIRKLNNPDGSAKAVMSGELYIRNMRKHQLMTWRLEKD